MNQYLLGLAGIAAIILIAVAFSSNRKAIRLRVVGAAFALQAVIAFLVLRTSGGRAVIQAHVGRRRRACSAMPPRAPNSCSARPRPTRWPTPSPSPRCR